MNLDANHYLTMVDEKLRPHVGHARVAFYGNQFVWAEFEIENPEPTGNPLGTVTLYPNGAIISMVNKVDNGTAYRVRGGEADMIAALERAK